MNTGLQDIWNLAWKLDLAVRGHATEGLLDSYTAERRPVIKHVIEVTDFMTKAMGTPSTLAQALRNTVIPILSHLAPFQHAFVQTLSELGVAYRGSPIVEGTGKRYFDDSLHGGNGILSRLLLLVGDDAHPASVEAAQNLSESLGTVVEFRSSRGQDITLIRPDGYIAYSASNHAGNAALHSVQSLLQRLTH